METRDTFVVTLFRDPRRSPELRGRVRHVASSREATFQSLEELSHLLHRSANDPLVDQSNLQTEEEKRENEQ